MAEYICVACGKTRRKMRCPRCGKRTIRKLEKNWFLSIGVHRMRNNDPKEQLKVALEEWPKSGP